MFFQRLLNLIRIIREFKVSPTQLNPMETFLNFFFKSFSLVMRAVSYEAQILLVFSQPSNEVRSAVSHELEIRLPSLSSFPYEP